MALLPVTTAQRSDVVLETADAWRDAVSNSFVPLLTEVPDGAFRGRIDTVERAGVRFSALTADPHRVHRTRRLAMASADEPFYKVSVQLAGSQLLTQDGREALLRPGDLAIYDSSRPYALASTDRFRSLVVMFPRPALELPEAAVAEITGTRMAGTDGVCGLVGRLLSEVSADLDAVAGATGVRLVNTLLSLVTAAVAERLDAPVGSTDADHRALVAQVQRFIEGRLADPDLGPETIAAAHFVSARHLQKVFHEEGQTVTGWIRARRLQRIRDDLADPLRRTRPVSAVGARWGYLDAAHFSRTFKTASGLTPGEYRARALADPLS